MATKKKNVHIEPFGLGNNQFALYSDIPKWAIKKIEGVYRVSDTLINEGYLIVIIDKRYDIDEVLSEIKLLGKS